MLKHLLPIAALSLSVCHPGWAQSTGHIGHGGSGGDEGCVKAKISHFEPEHLATVKPGADFSLFVSGALSPNHIHVTAKQLPVTITTEDKETFLVVKGKLPEELRNTTARIQVKVMAKYRKCDTEDGWLLKISE